MSRSFIAGSYTCLRDWDRQPERIPSPVPAVIAVTRRKSPYSEGGTFTALHTGAIFAWCRGKNVRSAKLRSAGLRDDKGGAGLLEDASLDCLPDGSAPPSVFNVFQSVELKLDADYVAAMLSVDILHDAHEIRNVSQSREFELETERGSRAQPDRPSNQ